MTNVIGGHTARILAERLRKGAKPDPMRDFLDKVAREGTVRETGNHPINLFIDHFNQMPEKAEDMPAWGRKAALLFEGCRNDLSRALLIAAEQTATTVTHP